MEFPEDQMEELKSLSSEVKLLQEGGATFIFIKNVAMPEGCDPQATDVLLCPTLRDGYPSRLYFGDMMKSKKTQNWNGQVRLLERNWHVYSWKINRTDLRLAQLVCEHLRALR